MTKIQFWKQFTTRRLHERYKGVLYSVWQRYNFESNLQPTHAGNINAKSCIQYDKDTILKAIYNHSVAICVANKLYSVWQRYNFESNLQRIIQFLFSTESCIQYDKDTILKAIYNKYKCLHPTRVLYSVWQRYNFESNLQRKYITISIAIRCIQYDKDTILKAIYNSSAYGMMREAAVFSMTKIQFWKQFTTTTKRLSTQRKLYSVWQRYNFESNLQHNAAKDKHKAAVFSMTKIQFWKQFTTSCRRWSTSFMLYSVWQRYNFESNLQQIFTSTECSLCCIQYDKDTILKAIYNIQDARMVESKAVFSMTKIQFWKQFTTFQE